MQDEINKINNAMFAALTEAQSLQKKVYEMEGDSDLYRKLSNYLVPNLHHWVTGNQAGSLKDLSETIERRNHEKN